MRSAYGTRYEEDGGGRLTAIVDRTGHAWVRLAWDGDQLAALEVPGPAAAPERRVLVDGGRYCDPLLGDAHEIRIGAAGDAGARTAMTALDWLRPREIPTVAAPGRLPPGAGGTVLDALAVLAARSGVAALRYAGPYPTPALWRSLGRSFRAGAGAGTGATEAAFTAQLIPRAARLAREPIEIDFAPAPCERVAIRGGHVELRSGVERVVLGGVGYERGGSPARLTDDGVRVRAELWFGDVPYAHVATLGPSGEVIDGPHEVPPCESRALGGTFPPQLVEAFADLVADAVPAPLAADVRAWVVARQITWADLGSRAAQARGGALYVHAALWERISPLGLGRLALALAEALAPVAAAAVIAAVLESSAAG